jgi:hypothetical protein
MPKKKEKKRKEIRNKSLNSRQLLSHGPFCFSSDLSLMEIQFAHYPKKATLSEHQMAANTRKYKEQKRHTPYY